MAYKKAKTKKSLEKDTARKNSPKRGGKKMTAGQWGIIAVMILGLIGLVIPNLPKKSNPRPELKDIATLPAVEPVFQKEGILTFNDGATGDAITNIDIEIADDEAQKITGLMYRKSMEENHGMLFIFDKSQPTQGFWMKNTYISIDIIFTNAEKEILTIHKNAEPMSEVSLRPKEPAIYVIEVVAGFCDKYGVKEGDTFDFETVRG